MITFLVNNTILPSDNPLRFTEKIKTINYEIEQNKAQYNLDR